MCSVASPCSPSFWARCVVAAAARRASAGRVPGVGRSFAVVAKRRTRTRTQYWQGGLVTGPARFSGRSRYGEGQADVENQLVDEGDEESPIAGLYDDETKPLSKHSMSAKGGKKGKGKKGGKMNKGKNKAGKEQIPASPEGESGAPVVMGQAVGSSETGSDEEDSNASDEETVMSVAQYLRKSKNAN
ncbi:unnamed protein product [Amoebophrya sp. A120]|nr:unnamed protein product [Amoebophrya sp. A120]|eukprot:GSA120T00014566001.1